jgi:hypothetical protein
VAIGVIPSIIGIRPIEPRSVISDGRSIVIIVIATRNRRTFDHRAAIDIASVVSIEVGGLRRNWDEANNGERRQCENKSFHEDFSLENFNQITPWTVNGS